MCCRDRNLLGIATAGQQCADFVADGPTGDVFAEFGDHTRAFEAEDVTRAWRRRVEALTLEQVGAVDGGRGDLDEYVPARQFGIGLLRPFHDLGTAGLIDRYGVHGYDASESPR